MFDLKNKMFVFVTFACAHVCMLIPVLEEARES